HRRPGPRRHRRPAAEALGRLTPMAGAEEGARQHRRSGPRRHRRPAAEALGRLTPMAGAEEASSPPPPARGHAAALLLSRPDA
ncbi:hypothetical protein, partial [Streptomyces purpureus]|uniref:hypothetical protein n=1 Tax=Streptomyces purpureus TaxID=1951 RepID=UPI001E60E6A8